MSLNPAESFETFVMTVTLQIVNFPTITYSEDITVTVAPPPTTLPPVPADPVKVMAPVPQIKIHTMTLNAKINQ